MILLYGLPVLTPDVPMEGDVEIYQRINGEIEQAVASKGALAAVSLLKQRIEENAHVASLCHPLAHAVGRAAYRKYGFEEALTYQDDVCGSGFLHGVVETHFIGLPHPEQAAHQICFADEPNCFHGIGHGLMLAYNNDIDRSLVVCATFKKAFQRIQCAEGVYMELFQIEDESHAVFASTRDPLTTCLEVEDPYRAVCAFYASRQYLRLHPTPRAGIFAFCDGFASPTIDACIKGAGSVLMRTAIDQPLSVQDLCLELPPAKRDFCIDGMVSYYIVHFSSVRKGQELCALVDSSVRERCMDAAI